MELVKQTTQQTLDSREVASMVEKPHNDLLKDIRKYIQYLGEGNFPQSDFFTESTYQNTQNKTQPCYNITKKGCEFIAHKLTGQKGAVFTATYINRFHEMEQGQALPKLSKEIQAIFVLDQKQQKFETRLDKLETDMYVTPRQMKKLRELRTKRVHNLIGERGSKAYEDRSFRGRVYADISRQVNNFFDVSEYAYIPKNQYEEAREVFKNYNLPCELAMELKKIQSA